MKSIFKRVMIKCSGEILKGGSSSGIDFSTLDSFADEIAFIYELGVEIVIQVGGGNFFRGRDGEILGLDRSTADYIGMTATLMNSMALQSFLENRKGIQTRVMSAISVSNFCEKYILRRAKRHIEKGRIIIFAAGTGNTHFTTDTAAVLRAIENSCEVVIKGTMVDGIYDKDPNKNVDAIKLLDTVTYTEVLSRDLRIMDQSALALARDNKMLIIIISLKDFTNLRKVILGKIKGTVIRG